MRRLAAWLVTYELEILAFLVMSAAISMSVFAFCEWDDRQHQQVEDDR